MRVSELFLSFPPLLLSLVAVTFLGPGLINALIALIISWWPWYARLIRVEASIVKSKPYVEISAAMGVPDRIIILREGSIVGEVESVPARIEEDGYESVEQDILHKSSRNKV
jgi:ABC-type microcin C transport system permease subunit YejE